MSAAIPQGIATLHALNPDEIQQISQPIDASSSQLQVLARKAEKLAVVVEAEWEDFSPQERELLEALIYSSIAHKGGTPGLLSLLSSLRVRLSLAWMLIRGEIDALIEYLNAIVHLKNAVLGAIERTHPDYEGKMTEGLEEALAESDNNPAMTSEDFREWLTNISD